MFLLLTLNFIGDSEQVNVGWKVFYVLKVFSFSVLFFSICNLGLFFNISRGFSDFRLIATVDDFEYVLRRACAIVNLRKRIFTCSISVPFMKIYTSYNPALLLASQGPFFCQFYRRSFVFLL